MREREGPEGCRIRGVGEREWEKVKGMAEKGKGSGERLCSEGDGERD